MSEFLEAALLYASMGWRVFPLKPRSKSPATVHGFKDATTDAGQISAWWTQNPAYNVGIATGDGLVVIDVDDKPKNPVQGSDMLRDWEYEHGHLSETVTAISGTGGTHYYYDVGDVSVPSSQSATLFIDLRGDGGYIVAPPSIHPDTGEPYMWDIEPSLDNPPAKVSTVEKRCLDWIYANRGTAGKTGAAKPHIEQVHEGEGRNNYLYKMGCAIRAQGADDTTISIYLTQVNAQTCKPPMDSDELLRVIQSVCRLPIGLSDEAKAAKEGKQSGASPGSSTARFNHAKLAKQLINEHHACFIDGVPSIFIDGRYETGWESINRAIVKLHENANSSNRKEIREYLALIAPQVESSPPNLIGFNNGVLDINTMQIREYTEQDVILNVIPHDWNAFAESPLVDDTLRKLAAGDPVIELNLTEFMGLCLYRSGELAYFPMLLGKKGKNASNGKSTYIGMIRSMLGNENCSSLGFNDLGQQFLKRYIAGKLANLGDDISAKQIDSNAIETVKKAAAGNRLFCDVKNGGAFEFNSYCTFIFSANRMPSFESDDDGLNRRMFPLRFNARFTRDDPDFDPKILDKLAEETACQRMLVRAVEGLKRCIANNGPTPNAESREMLDDIKEANNSILQWMHDVDRDAESFIGCKPTPLYESYREWCGKSGIQKPYGKPGFGKMLVELFAIESHTVSINGEKSRVYRRIED